MLLILGVGQLLPGPTYRDNLSAVYHACFVFKLFIRYSICRCQTVTCACPHQAKYYCRIIINRISPRTQTCNLAVIHTTLQTTEVSLQLTLE